MVHKSGHPFQRTLSTLLSLSPEHNPRNSLNPSFQSHSYRYSPRTFCSLFSLEASYTSPSSHWKFRIFFRFSTFHGPRSLSSTSALYGIGTESQSRAVHCCWHTSYSTAIHLLGPQRLLPGHNLCAIQKSTKVRKSSAITTLGYVNKSCVIVRPGSTSVVACKGIFWRHLLPHQKVKVSRK